MEFIMLYYAEKMLMKGKKLLRPSMSEMSLFLTAIGF